MALSLIKLFISAETTTDTTTVPTAAKYFYTFADAQRTGDVTTIPSTLFTDDAGDAVVGNLVTAATDNGYYLLSINGITQETGIFTVGATGDQVVITNTTDMLVGVPIILTVTNFAPVSDSTTTVET